MLLVVVAYVSGVLTILSPCILPVLPFVFARSDQPFRKAGLPLLLAMALTFVVIGTLAAVGGAWAVAANQWGRYIAMLLLAVFGVMLLFPAFAERLMQPLVALGSRLSSRADSGQGFGSSFLLGIATGLLWAPCAGPVLGLILATAALSGASLQTVGLLLAYAAGAATSLALALLAGGRVFAFLKRSLGAGVWVRRGLGVAVLAGVLMVATGMDRGLLTKLSAANTESWEQTLLDVAGLGASRHDEPQRLASVGENGMAAPGSLPVEGQMPSLSGATAWLNSKPLKTAELRGKVVLIDFWTYSCINCLRALPHVQTWARRYRDDGLVVIGVHTPEFAFERDIDNVREALERLDVRYPVALDNRYAIWRAFDNHYWPAHYLIDAQGRIRYHHFGEGHYKQTENAIRSLLAEAGKTLKQRLADSAAEPAVGVKAQANFAAVESPETYLGYARAEGFVPGLMAYDMPMDYELPQELLLNQWGLGGSWVVAAEKATLQQAGGRIAFRFHARDLNLVLGPAEGGEPVHFQVLIDGEPPGEAHGVDTDASGRGVVTEERLYQLLRQKGDIGTHRFEIRFVEPGVSAYAFTFG